MSEKPVVRQHKLQRGNAATMKDNVIIVVVVVAAGVVVVVVDTIRTATS